MYSYSRALLALYQASGSGSFFEFQTTAIRLLHECLDFDGVILGGTTIHTSEKISIVSAHLDGRPRGLMDDYFPLLSSDPLMRSILAGLQRPLQVDLSKYYEILGLHSLDGFACKHALRHIMAFGDQPHPQLPIRWIILLTNKSAPFPLAKQKVLAQWWPHLSLASAMCATRTESVRHFVLPQRGSAILNSSREIECADKEFFELLRLEWPDKDLSDNLEQVRTELLRTCKFKGKWIEIIVLPGSRSVCHARPTAACRTMTPRETVVARRFAAGLSHKEVARELGISPHTVRTQLMHVYSKLRLHDKGALANYLMSQGEPEPAAFAS